MMVEFLFEVISAFLSYWRSKRMGDEIETFLIRQLFLMVMSLQAIFITLEHYVLDEEMREPIDEVINNLSRLAVCLKKELH